MTTAQDAAEQLMNAMLDPAEQMLLDHGFFYPYGGAMKSGGEIVTVGGMDPDEEPKPEELFRNIKDKLRTGAVGGGYQATALVFPADTTTADGAPLTCIAVALEHRADYAVLVLIPWRLEGGEVQFGEPFAQKGKREIFPATP